MAKKKLQARRKQAFRPSFGWVRPALALLTVLGSALGLTLMLEWMKNPQQWPVKRVQIEGEFRYLQAEQLEAAVAPLAARGFFVVAVSEIQSRLQSLAWVDEVAVRRVWPDKLDISVREQRPVARWGADGYVNARAEVFTPEQKVVLEGLSQLDGPEGHQQRVLDMQASVQALLRPLQLEVSRLHLTARRAWRLQLSNGLTLEVGRSHPLQRVARFVRVYPAILASGTEGRLTGVDLRYSNGFAAHWQTPEAEAQQTGRTG
jgi:cell division protein FtsQ